jgi:hypothetical protein
MNGIARFIDFLGRKHKLLIVSTDLNARVHSYQYTIYPILSRSRFRYLNIFNVISIVRLCKKYSVKYLIAEQPFIAWQVYLASKILGLPFYLHNHNIEFERARTTGKKWWKLVQPVEGWMMRKAKINFFKTAADRDMAIATFGIRMEKTYIVPYGVNHSELPTDNALQREAIVKRHNLNTEEKILFFFGVLTYQPNVIALELIVKKIIPILKTKHPDFKFKVLVCGKGDISPLLRRGAGGEALIHAGFVDDIDEYIKGADVILNPTITGGGIKTKVVEAIGFDKNVVSTKIGAEGVDANYCGGKLLISPDDDWKTFTQNIVKAADFTAHTPDSFFKVHYWGSIVEGMNKFFL